MANQTKNFIQPSKNQGIKESIDNILDCVIYIDNNYNIQRVNLETMNLLGYKEQQIIGKRLDFILGEYFVHRWGDFCKFFAKWPVRNHDVVLKKKGGTEIPIKMNVTPLCDNNGLVTGWLITAKDMTYTRDIIRELARSRKELEQTIKELEQSRDELIQSEKLSFAGRMAASVAHEIRNPLNIIGMAIQQLHNELGKRDKRREYTGIITKNIDRVDKLITEFVNVARPPKLKMQWEDINRILEDVLKLIQPKANERKASIIKNLDPGLPKIRIDEEHMAQAFQNIMLNACDALPKRGGKISVASKKEVGHIVIQFRNTGKPIPEKDIIKIFDPFFSTKRTGTGLGLSIAYGVIGSHRGTIGVESNKKIGTIFTVRLSLQTDRQTDRGAGQI